MSERQEIIINWWNKRGRFVYYNKPKFVILAEKVIELEEINKNECLE